MTPYITETARRRRLVALFAFSDDGLRLDTTESNFVSSWNCDIFIGAIAATSESQAPARALY